MGEHRFISNMVSFPTLYAAHLPLSIPHSRAFWRAMLNSPQSTHQIFICTTAIVTFGLVAVSLAGYLSHKIFDKVSNRYDDYIYTNKKYVLNWNRGLHYRLIDWFSWISWPMSVTKIWMRIKYSSNFTFVQSMATPNWLWHHIYKDSLHSQKMSSMIS